MITVQRDVRVDAPAELVFDHLADARNEERWNPNVVRLTMASSGPIGLGSVFDGVYRRGGPMRFEVTVYERPTRLVFDGGGRQMRLLATVTVAAAGETTVVRMRADIGLRGARRLLAPLARRMIERQYADVVRRFAAAIEQEVMTP